MIAASALCAVVACADEQPSGAATAAPATATAQAALAVEINAPSTVDEGATLTLSGQITTPADAAGCSFAWKQRGDGPRASLLTPYAAATSLQAPESTSDYELLFQLEVTRGEQVAQREVTVAVRADDDPPEAEAIVPESSECGARVVLVGQGRSYEPRQALRFQWKQIGDGPRVQLENPDGPQASFVAPELPGEYLLWFDFHVRDGVNPDVVVHTKVSIECDAAGMSLRPGATRALGDAAEAAQALPRGSWELAGSLELAQSSADRGAVATLRFEYTPQHAVAIQLAENGSRAGLRMCGLARERPDDDWREPESSGERELGEWPADQALGFAFEWDGRELAFHWGPPGERAHWPELPFPVAFPLAARPRALAVEAAGGEVRLGALVLTGR